VYHEPAIGVVDVPLEDHAVEIGQGDDVPRAVLMHEELTLLERPNRDQLVDVLRSVIVGVQPISLTSST